MTAWARTVGFGVLAVLLAGLAFRATGSSSSSGSGPATTARPSAASTASADPPEGARSPVVQPAARAIYLSTSAPGSSGGVRYGDEDLLSIDVDTGRPALYLDGSDLGLPDSARLDGFHLRGDGEVLFSLTGPADLPGVGPVDGTDVLAFVPTATATANATGSDTAGALSLYFDGSNHGLTTAAGNVDAVGLDRDGRLLISTVDEVALGFGAVAAEDVLAFDGASLVLFLDGSAVGLDGPGENVAAISVDPSGVIHLSTAGDHRVPGAFGGPADLLQCVPTGPAPITGCDWSTYRSGEGHEVAVAAVTGLTITGAVNYFTAFDEELGPEWLVYDSIGHAGWGLRRPSAVALVSDPAATDGSRLTVTARMGSGSESGQLVSGGLKLLAPQTYGRYTVRLKAQPDPEEVTSMVALLWPESNEWPRDGEIDIVETWNARATRSPVETTLHWLDPDAVEPFHAGDDIQRGEVHPGVNGAEWHTYILQWRPDVISVAVDGGPPVVLSRDPGEIADWNMEPTLQLDAFDPPYAPGRQPVLSQPITMTVDYLLVQP